MKKIKHGSGKERFRIASLVWPVRETSMRSGLDEKKPATASLAPYSGYQLGHSYSHGWHEWPRSPRNDPSHVSLESKKSSGGGKKKSALVFHQLWKTHQAAICSGIASARPVFQNLPSTGNFSDYISKTHLRVFLRGQSKKHSLLIWTFENIVLLQLTKEQARRGMTLVVGF